MTTRMAVAWVVVLMAVHVAGCGSSAASSANRAMTSVETSGDPAQNTDMAEIPSIARATPVADEYERLGDAYVRQGNRTLALRQYDHALQSAPRHARVRHKKYLLYLTNGLHAEAVAGFRELVREKPSDARAWEGLGRSLLHAGQEREAEDALRQAVQADGRLWRAHSLLGMLHERRHAYEHAVSAYRTALELKPDRPELHNNLGRAYYLIGDHRRAIEEFESAKAHGYSAATVHNNLGLALAKTGAYREALDSFRRGGAESQAFYNIGVVYFDAGKAAEAAICFQNAIDANPKFDRRATEQLAAAQAVLRRERTGRTLRPEQDEKVCS